MDGKWRRGDRQMNGVPAVVDTAESTGPAPGSPQASDRRVARVEVRTGDIDEAPPVVSRLDLEMLIAHLDTAAHLLSGPEPACASLARQRLASVERRLGDLVAEVGPVASLEANWLLMTRNDLSVHLSAACTLSAEGLHGRAAALLQGAIETVRSRLERPVPSLRSPG